MKKQYIVIILVTLVILSSLLFLKINKKDSIEDNIRFKQEYNLVPEDNVFTYRNIDEIINILEKGTGIVYLGFPECKWCAQYVVYLNEVARQNGINKIYYFNIKEDRSNNTSKYQKIVSLLSENLVNDNEGNKRVFVPDVSFVIKGNIIGHDNESSYGVSGEPIDYWTTEKLENLKSKLKQLMLQVKQNECSSCEG